MVFVNGSPVSMYNRDRFHMGIRYSGCAKSSVFSTTTYTQFLISEYNYVKRYKPVTVPEMGENEPIV